MVCAFEAGIAMSTSAQRPDPHTASRSSVARTVYWFRAKPSGLGWDWPLCWQGWLTYALALVGLIAGVLMFPPNRSLGAFLISHAVVVMLVLVVVALKGEPLRKSR